MGLAPYTRQPGITPPKTDDDQFHPIPLIGYPIFSSEDDSTPSSFIFKNKASSFDLANVNTWRGRFHLRDSLHEGIAGVTGDGFTIYAMSGRIGGQPYTAMGAFGPSGKPTPITPTQKSTLEKYFTPSPKPIVLDALSKSAIGLKMSDPNIGVGAYIGNNEAIFVVHGMVSLGDNSSLSAEGRLTTDWNGNVVGRAFSLAAKGRDASITGDLERNGSQIVRKVDASMGNWSLNGQYNTNGSKRDRQLGVGYKVTKWATVSVAYKPDNKPSATRLTPYQLSEQLRNPTQPMPDHSNISFQAKITF
jgi:hypothetical protein